jgi:hypothetical protein|nr:MAG TPA: hypothetical protein [Caudoviricetes sp.]
MKVIYKYQLSDWSETIKMPKDAEILTAHLQGENTYIWAMVETDNPTEERTFAIIGTGNPIKYIGEYKYINTIFQGAYVWHIFEIK